MNDLNDLDKDLINRLKQSSAVLPSLELKAQIFGPQKKPWTWEWAAAAVIVLSLWQSAPIPLVKASPEFPEPLNIRSESDMGYEDYLDALKKELDT